MGDRLRAGKTSRFVTSHSAFYPQRDEKMSTGQCAVSKGEESGWGLKAGVVPSTCG